jgi:hypothetical protein
MFRKESIHWWIVLPSIAILLLVTSVLTVLVLFAGRSDSHTRILSVEEQQTSYIASIAALRARLDASSGSPADAVRAAEDWFLSARVPADRLDTHLAGMLQLQSLKRTLSASPDDTAAVRANILTILDAASL